MVSTAKGSAKYSKANTKRYSFEMNLKTDSDVIAVLDEQKSKQGYVKQLIRKDNVAELVTPNKLYNNSYYHTFAGNGYNNYQEYHRGYEETSDGRGNNDLFDEETGIRIGARRCINGKHEYYCFTDLPEHNDKTRYPADKEADNMVFAWRNDRYRNAQLMYKPTIHYLPWDGSRREK